MNQSIMPKPIKVRQEEMFVDEKFRKRKRRKRENQREIREREFIIIIIMRARAKISENVDNL